MTETEEYVHVKREDQIATITLDRPEAKNAMFPPLSKELLTVVEEINESNTRVAVIRGSDDAGVFCAGGDLDVSPEEFMEDVELVHDVVKAVHNGPVPYIAEIEGAAMGGGLELAAACDLRIVSTDAVLSVPEVSLGVFPGAGGTRLLPRLIGTAKAMDLVLTGRRLSGEEAEEIGLATRTVEPDQLRDEVEDIASTIAANSPVAIAGTKKSVHDAFNSTFEKGLEWDLELMRRLVRSDHFEEGTDAFIERREPDFPDRI